MDSVKTGDRVAGTFSGTLKKMQVTWPGAENPVQYELDLGSTRLNMMSMLGAHLRLQFNGKILCIHCQRATKKSFGQGYCYPCFIKLPQCDICIVKPERCHFEQGTCRDRQWGEQHCFIEHTVYLANSSGLKVGITRSHQQMTRWIDQGASQALPLARVASRKQAGLIEVALKEHVADKTDWRLMLKGAPAMLDLEQHKQELLKKIPADLQFDVVAEPAIAICYPVTQYPLKVVSHNFDKNPLLEGTLVGIKGQYLIFEHCVINIRTYTGYEVQFEKL